jgi:hypothetical protein
VFAVLSRSFIRDQPGLCAGLFAAGGGPVLTTIAIEPRPYTLH